MLSMEDRLDELLVLKDQHLVFLAVCVRNSLFVSE